MSLLFRFKQFRVEDSHSTMKVNTDAVLLGAWADVVSTGYILDAGTGCGVIALMLAQRCQAMVHAIDVDAESIREASANFRNSPWSNRLTAIETRLQDYSQTCEFRYDAIVSNPPFFEKDLPPKDHRKLIARHDSSLTFHDLLISSARLLTHNGSFSMILPVTESDRLHKTAEKAGLFLWRELKVKSTSDGPLIRKLVEYRRAAPGFTVHEELTLYNPERSRTQEYQQLTKNYYL